MTYLDVNYYIIIARRRPSNSRLGRQSAQEGRRRDGHVWMGRVCCCEGGGVEEDYVRDFFLSLILLVLFGCCLGVRIRIRMGFWFVWASYGSWFDYSGDSDCGFGFLRSVRVTVAFSGRRRRRFLPVYHDRMGSSTQSRWVTQSLLVLIPSTYASFLFPIPGFRTPHPGS